MAALPRSERGEPAGLDRSPASSLRGRELCRPRAASWLGLPVSRAAKTAQSTHHGVHRRGTVTNHQEDRASARKHTGAALSL